MSSNSPNSGDHDFHTTMYQWSARMSGIAFEMVVPAITGVGLDRLCGTVVLFALLGVLLGMVLGFWQLLKIAQNADGIDKLTDTRDNKGTK